MVHGLGERLQQKRSGLKISQKEAAEAIGVSYSIISNYEKNERTPIKGKFLLIHCFLAHCFSIPYQLLT